MPIEGVDGLASGLQTNEMVRKLVEIEKRPLYQLEANRKELQFENDALAEMRKRTQILQEKLKALHDYDAGFESKAFIPDIEGYLAGTANKKAQEAEHRFEILQLAASLSASSKPMNPDEKLSAGRITINGKTADFRGGNLNALRDLLNSRFKDLLVTKTILVRPKESVLMLDGKIAGEDGVLQIEDPDGILAQIGLYKGAGAQATSDPSLESRKKQLFDESRLRVVSDGPANISPDMASLRINDKAARRLESPSPVTEGEQILALELSATKMQSPDADEAPAEIIDGPVEKLNIAGIELESYNIDRDREKPPVPSGDFGVIVIYADSGSEKVSLSAKSGLNRLPLSGPVAGLTFYTEGQEVQFADLAWISRKIPKGKIPDVASQKDAFPNLIRAAANARFRLDGVELERQGNSELKDVLDGVTLNLFREEPGKIITVRILNDGEKAVTQIVDFVKAYNDTLMYAREASKTAEVKSAGEFNKAKAESGILVANPAIRNLITGLKTHVADAYPAFREPQIRIMPMIGISTGKVGADWSDIKDGYLQVDEAKLREMLASHPESVKEFFASDSNSDGRLDNGFAWKTERFLQPYTRFTGGIITAQINSNQDKMKRMDQDKEKLEAHAKAYEKRLKEKFGYMESNIRQQKATGDFLKNRMKAAE